MFHSFTLWNYNFDRWLHNRYKRTRNEYFFKIIQTSNIKSLQRKQSIIVSPSKLENSTYLDFKKSNLFGHDTNRNSISMVNHALQMHSMKKKAWCAWVSYLSNVHPRVWFEVVTVIFFMRGTLMSGCVLMQKETIETTMKKTDITPTTWKLKRYKN